MKLVILAGGYGSRLSEETVLKPKPLVEIGGKPLIWHIMKIYSFYGINDFMILCGYKGNLIKEYFINYFKYNSDLEINTNSNKFKVLEKPEEKWKVQLIDTGENTLTGGRLNRIKKYIKSDEVFCLTYGDGVAPVNIKKLIQFHKKNKKNVTVTAVQPKGRYGSIKIDKKGEVSNFEEKPSGDNMWVNGGFFILNKKSLRFLKKDSDIWEQEGLKELANLGELGAYKHSGFWKAMDTLSDKKYLDTLWNSGNAPWKIWKD